MSMTGDVAVQGRGRWKLGTKDGLALRAKWGPVLAALVAILIARGARAQPQSPPQSQPPSAAAPAGDLPAETLAVFQAKCAACHGPQAAKPKKFGYVTDLMRLAANPKYVIPHDPDKSGLWQAIDEGDMPPDDAKTGPLSDVQKQTVRNWIEAGAPAPTL